MKKPCVGPTMEGIVLGIIFWTGCMARGRFIGESAGKPPLIEFLGVVISPSKLLKIKQIIKWEEREQDVSSLLSCVVHLSALLCILSMSVTEGRHGCFLMTLGWGKAYCHLLRPDPEGTSQVSTYGPRDCCQYSWQPFWGVLCREHHACISACPVCLSPLDAFLNALILENVFCVDLSLSLCFSAFVHCNGPEASWQSMMRTVLGIRKGWV